MSEIMKVIDRIAVFVEQKSSHTRLDTLTFEWMLGNSYHVIGKSTEEIKNLRNSLSHETLQEITQAYAPRLTLEQIQEITRDYPFQLPVEMCELYQRGNGCLPIGLDSPSKDWSSFDNYFDFPDLEKPLFPLEKAIRIYKSLTDSRELYGYNVDPRWFPISYFEDCIQAVIGNEKQQDTSPVIYFYDSDFIPEIEYLSLTEMLESWLQ